MTETTIEKLALQTVLDLQELHYIGVLLQFGALDGVELEQRSSHSTGWVSMVLLEEPLGTSDTSLDKSGIRCRGKILQDQGLFQFAFRGELEQACESLWVHVTQAHDGTVGSRGKDRGQQKIGKSTKSNKVRCGAGFSRVVCKLACCCVGGDSSELPDRSASKLDTANVGSFSGDLGDEVRVEIDATRSAREVVHHNGDRTGVGDVDEELLEGRAGELSGEVSGCNDNRNIGASLSGRLAKSDSLPSRPRSTVTSISTYTGMVRLTFQR